MATVLASARRRTTHIARWAVLGSIVGVVSGALSAAFIEALSWSTNTREARDWLVWLLPVAGLIVGCAYHYLGRGLERGNNLIIEGIHGHGAPIPLRLAPLIFGASVVTHVTGGSAGREGAALQLAAGVTDPLSTRIGLSAPDRTFMLIAAVAGGFGSVVGVPVAGAVFALEVQRAGRVRHDALIAAFAASFSGVATVHVLGVSHTVYPTLDTVDWTPALAWKVALFGVFAGLVAMIFVVARDAIRSAMRRFVRWYPARPMLGGALLVILVLACGWRDYQGLSFPLAVEAMNGSTDGQWSVKLGLTALTIGTGFVGGEVIPLFVVGALAGAGFASVTGANVALFATVGSVAVLAGAMNTPLACTIVGVELFGGSGVVVFALACALAYASSGHTGIYQAQTVAAPKGGAQES